MTTNNPISQYVLGSTDAEHERLIRQAARLNPFTERLFREAGIAATSRVRAALSRSTPGCRKDSSTFYNHAPHSASAYAPCFFTLLKYVPCSRSGISPSCFGCHPRSSRVRLLEAG